MGDTFDVVIVGAGPAGGQLARVLSPKGHRVLVVDRVADLADNDFSTAGVPLEMVDRFSLPPAVVGSRFSDMTLVSTSVEHTWTSPVPIGAILDFAALRRFLVDEAITHGAELRLRRRYVGHVLDPDGMSTVRFATGDGAEETVRARLVVDATGAARAVVASTSELRRPKYITATGLEYLIDVDDATYARFDDRVVCFLGHRWAPRGYSWICQMRPNRLKVGVGVVNLPHARRAPIRGLKHDLDLVFTDYLGAGAACIVDVHGGVLRFAKRFDDVVAERGAVGIGDAVSSLNALGAEGVRHAMDFGDIAARHVDEALRSGRMRFSAYRRELRRKYRRPWGICWRLAKAFYLELSDQQIDGIMHRLKHLTSDELLDVLYRYRFIQVGRSATRSWLVRKAKALWADLRRRVPGAWKRARG